MRGRREKHLRNTRAATPQQNYITFGGDIMREIIKCLDCKFFDRCDGFNSSNLRRCTADGRLHWKGDNAENCVNFIFREDEDRYAG